MARKAQRQKTAQEKRQDDCPHDHRRTVAGVTGPDGNPITTDTVYCGSCGKELESA